MNATKYASHQHCGLIAILLNALTGCSAGLKSECTYTFLPLINTRNMIKFFYSGIPTPTFYVSFLSKRPGLDARSARLSLSSCSTTTSVMFQFALDSRLRGSGCGTTGRAFTSGYKNPRFTSRLWSNIFQPMVMK